jgi:hypothetical protein
MKNLSGNSPRNLSRLNFTSVYRALSIQVKNNTENNTENAEIDVFKQKIYELPQFRKYLRESVQGAWTAA